MGYPTDRVLLYDKDDSFIAELSPSEVMERTRTEEINGVHELTIRTTRVLAVGTRILTVDGTGRWREHVVSEPDEAHVHGDAAVGTYVCMWSMQYDLTGTYSDDHAEPGMGPSWQSSGRFAVQCAIDGTDRWVVGSVDVPDVISGEGCVMIAESAWSRLSKVVDAWGGEVDSEIGVGPDGIVSRAVALRAHLGTTEVTRRFDWGSDLTEIHRIPDPGPYFCRVVPTGRGQTEYADDDETTFEWPLFLTDDPEVYPEFTENWIEDPEAALAFRLPDGDGGWEYPTKVVHYDTDDVGILNEMAVEDLHNHTRPGVTYSASVIQYARAGMDVRGVELGDDVHIVDGGFNAGAPLRLQGRVVSMTVDELNPETGTELTIGQLGDSFGERIALSSESVTSINQRVAHIESGGAIAYVSEILKCINSEINAGGGYTYFVQGEGMLTYDVEVSDPLVGAEASSVVQIKDGNLRIANSRDGSGDWEFMTVIQSGHVAAPLVTFVNAIGGYIGSPTSVAEIDLDNNTFRFGGNAVIGDRTMQQVLESLDSTATLANESASALDALTREMGLVHADLLAQIADARRYADDYLTYENGELTLGVTGTEIKNVIGAVRQTYRTEAGDVAWYGLNDEGVWEMFIETASINNMLNFNRFSWIARKNGNMSLKWTGVA